MEKLTKSMLQQPNRSIAWSKNGFIAYSIPSHKQNLLLTYLENINGKTWRLAVPQELTVKPNIENSIAPELHLLEWSNLSTDLAITDIYGNFYIMLSGVSLLEEVNASGFSGSANGTPLTANTNGNANTSGNGHSNNNSGTFSLGGVPNTSPNYELTSYNHLETIYRDITVTQLNQRPNPSAKIVGVRWLPIDKPQIITREAKLVNINPEQSLDNNKIVYSYGVNQCQPSTLCHPIPTKQACIGVRTNGELLLYYQGEHKVEYYKLSESLTANFNYNVKITYAEFGFPSCKENEPRYILLVTYDELSNKIRSYKVYIDWGFLVESASKQKVDPHYNTPKEAQNPPKLSIEVMHEMVPLLQNEFNSIGYDDEKDQPINHSIKRENDDELMDIDSNMDIDMDVDSSSKPEYKPKYKFGKISSIEIVSPHSEEGEECTDVLIFYENYDENFKISTFICRYRITSNYNIISNAFQEIGYNKGIEDKTNVGEKSLVLFDQKLIPDQIISCATTCAYLSLVLGNGNVMGLEKSPQALKEFTPTTVLERISCLSHLGFKVPNIPIDKNPVICGFSPTHCAVVYFEVNQEANDLKLLVSRKEGYLELTPEELYRTSVGLAFYHAMSCYLNSSCDDLLIVMQFEIERVHKNLVKLIDKSKVRTAVDSFIESIICESHKAINFQLDSFNKESVDKLLSNPPLQKLLSLQLTLGGLEFRLNSISQNIAWIVLNLRSTSFGIMFSLSSIYRQISKKKPTEDTLQDSISRAESIISLTGNVRWLVELIIYLNQEILELYMSEKNGRDSKIGYKNSIVLPILLSKVPRLFLMYSLSSLSKTQEVLKRLNKDLIDANKLFTPMKDALNRYFTSCTNSPLNLNLFENFIRESDTYILKEMNNLSTIKPKGYTLKLEQQLVCHGKLNEDLLKMGRWVIDKYASFIIRDLKVAEMYYYDVDWLSIGCNKVDEDFDSQYALIKNQPVFVDSSSIPTLKMIPKQKYGEHGVIDSLRKVIISMDQKGLRKCTRCRSISLISDPLIFNQGNIGLWTMVFQRTCVCGAPWVNIS